MNRRHVRTNGVARAFQAGALLIVASCVLLVMLHDMSHRAPTAGDGPRYPQLADAQQAP